MPQWYRNNAQVYCAEDTSVLSHRQDRIANGIKRNTQTLQLWCQQPSTPLLQQCSLLSSRPALHFDQLNLLVPVEYLLGESKSGIRKERSSRLQVLVQLLLAVGLGGSSIERSNVDRLRLAVPEYHLETNQFLGAIPSQRSKSCCQGTELILNRRMISILVVDSFLGVAPSLVFHS
jgi:hypothetical protein